MSKRKAFMIMPFNDNFFEVFEMLRREFESDFEFSHAGEEGNQQNILKDIIQPIYDADVIIADLTGLNPNVLYELGVAHTFNKKTIIITQDDLASLPFDLKSYRAKSYTTHFKKFAELVEDMKRNLDGVISGDVVFSNPVKDFISFSNISNTPWFVEDKVQLLTDNEDKGFLDFIVEIEQATDRIIESTENTESEMKVMLKGMMKSAEAVEKTSGSGFASFAHKEVKKAATYMNTFAAALKIHNSDFTNSWNSIEKGILGLLEMYISGNHENKFPLINYLKVLKSFQLSAVSTKKSIIGFKESLLRILGNERTLNQAIRFLDEDLQTYLEAIDITTSSIDKIIKKSIFVVGEIDFS